MGSSAAGARPKKVSPGDLTALLEADALRLPFADELLEQLIEHLDAHLRQLEAAEVAAAGGLALPPVGRLSGLVSSRQDSADAIEFGEDRRKLHLKLSLAPASRMSYPPGCATQ